MAGQASAAACRPWWTWALSGKGFGFGEMGQQVQQDGGIKTAGEGDMPGRRCARAQGSQKSRGKSLEGS
jgi:hypothetical protein